MNVVISIFVVFFTLIFSVYKGIFVGYPLLLGFFVFVYISLRKGFLLKDIIKMSISGIKKAFIVLKIFILIGAITGVWMASGTVPAIIYYGILHMNPHFFILYTFLISCMVSFLLGTSFGTISTVGLALMLIAKTGNINVNLAAGAIMSGTYFGDRCSPMSSSANLVANLTQTDLYINIKNMFKTSIIPFILSVIIYFILSLKAPLHIIDSKMHNEIINVFQINWIVLLPAIIILVFALFKIDVKISMLVSIAVASIIAIFIQYYKPIEVLNFIFLGFHLDKSSSLQNILKGGGILSMLKSFVVVFISCSLAGIFDGTNMLSNIENILMKAKTRYDLLVYTTITSIITAAFGCNQSISTVLTNQLMKKSYLDKNIDKYQFAIDLENTGIVLSPLIPWNIAVLVPATIMGVDSIGFIPYSFYLYLIPIINIVLLKYNNKYAFSDASS
ncbi:Na+/H+ antiporter NhaC family protein [Anaerophilus nitritogenes]|uniref:Na+/H+ antiporter NhaC family protein n=1 Tax=Anaerophilus nitritogenes TaxID=2498136 RepID=UPI00101C719D|nr:Na+/H+ antiporter NhaC family protein [Anaerophilus nitritogenes]